MEITPKSGTYSYRFGLIAAGTSIVFSLMLYFMDMTYIQSPIIQAINVLIPTTLAVLAIVNFKKDNQGLLSLKQSIKMGVGVFLITAIIGLFYFAIFINVIEPDFVTNTAQLQAETLRETNPKLGVDGFQMQQDITEKFFYMIFPYILIMNVIIGLVTGLVTGFFSKNS